MADLSDDIFEFLEEHESSAVALEYTSEIMHIIRSHIV